jgi:hypothetical protein
MSGLARRSSWALCLGHRHAGGAGRRRRPRGGARRRRRPSPLLPGQGAEEHRRGHLIEFGGGGARTTFAIGSFSINALDSPTVLSSLPRFLHLRHERRHGQAFQSILDLFAEETARPNLGTDALLGRLCEMLARQVGYDSESAFKRSFKRVTGMSPGAFRKTSMRPDEPGMTRLDNAE